MIITVLMIDFIQFTYDSYIKGEKHLLSGKLPIIMYSVNIFF